MSILYAVSQLGLVLYMFLIGLEFNIELIRSRLSSAFTRFVCRHHRSVLARLCGRRFSRPRRYIFHAVNRHLGSGIIYGRGDVNHGVSDAGANHL